jgi:homoserine/homoserine lactone efflux protein
MATEIWVSFVGISLVLGLIPGPSVCFTIAYGIRYGSGRTLPSILGQLLANAIQMFIVFVGLHRLLEQSAGLFIGLKMLGAIYLVYLGVKQWRARMPVLDANKKRDSKSLGRCFLDGFLVCGMNPKALLYYGAFFPQFIVAHLNQQLQFVILGLTSLLIFSSVLLMYTFLAGKARYWLLEKGYWRLQNRFTGTVMIGAGTALALAKKK